jgi:alpha-L-fucosidase
MSHFLLKHFMKLRPIGALGLLAFAAVCGRAAEMPEMWSNEAMIDARLGRPDTRWFEDAKFGLFVHWGLYSAIGNEWKGREYFGSGEWLMNRAKIPAAEYAKLAETFNPTGFNADEWGRFAKDAGVRYMVVTAKHHEGFAMFASKASPFNIVDATPYHQDPMAALAKACQREGVKFGFYYSQFLDWHEPNGGGNRWDFDEKTKDVKRYYAEKSIPQIKELLSNYGPLGVVWFDMPGGLSREETVSFMQEVRRLQPSCLISSRVGRGLGDFRDFGDSELPATFIDGPWEALFTHNDSWGFVRTDHDFKTPRDIIRLLAATAARGGNLLLNVGPDGTGRIPDLSLQYLREVGRWLSANGESIYGTTHSPVADQPWGVATRKTNRLYLHVFTRPHDGDLLVPAVSAKVTQVRLLGGADTLRWRQQDSDLVVSLPRELPDDRDTVVQVDFAGEFADAWQAPFVISNQFDAVTLDAARGAVAGATALKSLTHSAYFGNWKHDTCAIGMAGPADALSYAARVLAPGDYRVALDYACPIESKERVGVLEVADQSLTFETLQTLTKPDTHQPLIFVHHSIGIVHFNAPATVTIRVHPKSPGAELFWLRRIVIEPVR